jgi:hypothetical protein
MVDRDIMEKAKGDANSNEEASPPTSQAAAVIEAAVASAINGRLDQMVESICDRLGELAQAVNALELAEPEASSDEVLLVCAGLSSAQQSALNWLNARLEQVDLEEVEAGFNRGGGVYRPDADLLHLAVSTSDRKFINWPTLADGDFDPGFVISDGTSFSEHDTLKMAELVESVFTAEEQRNNAWIFSKKETDQWMTQLQILLEIDSHQKVLPLFWRMFGEGLPPEQLLVICREEAKRDDLGSLALTSRIAELEHELTGVRAENAQLLAHIDALVKERNQLGHQLESGGRLADWSMYHLCEEIGIAFPDEETRRKAVALAEKSTRPAKAS